MTPAAAASAPVPTVGQAASASDLTRIRCSMVRRLAGIAALFLALAPAAKAATLGLAEVRASDGTLVARAGNGAFAYPADGSILRIGSANANAARVELRDVTMFSGRVYVSRIVVPARGLLGARVDGLVADGKAYVVGPNALIHLQGGSYIVALQEAVSPGRHGSGLVALRVYVSDPSLGLAPGTQLLVGLARAAHPTGPVNHATAILGLPQLAAAQASMEGVPSAAAPISALLPAIAGNGIGAQAVALAEHFLGVPYVWGGASPSGFDCSGLVMYVYGLLGVQLPHYSGSQWYSGPRVPLDQLEPGDIVFFHPSANGPQHEGMYIGQGEFIQAPHTGDVVKISSLYDPQYALSYVGAVRPYAAGASSPHSSAPSASPLPMWTSASG
jgi:cell wall-associated NlpC family hydrolase